MGLRLFVLLNPLSAARSVHYNWLIDYARNGPKMPIYEYRCGNCKRRVSIFFPSFSAAESRITSGEAKCPRCGSPELSRLMSKVRVVRGGANGGEGSDDFDTQDLPGSSGDFGSDSFMEGLENEDPRAIARWARQMKESMGEEGDLGPEFDRALARIEAGEDPDKVMEDLDPDAMAGAPGDDEALDDLGPGDDF
jgi:putative FmdB family regulatory protein